MNYKIEIKEIEPITVAAMRYKGIVGEAGKHMPAIFKAIKGKANGAPFFCFYEVDEQTLNGDLELCVPTEEIPNAGGIQSKELPRIKAVCTTHVGRYDTLKFAYKALHHYIQENGLHVQTPWRETYIKGPGAILKGNPGKYITEIAIPIEQE